MENNKAVNIQIASDFNNFEALNHAGTAIDSRRGIRRRLPNRNGLSAKRMALKMNCLYFERIDGHLNI
jgi:hypothetical protein